MTKLDQIRPMTEQEKEAFYKIPEGAIWHKDIKAWNKACKGLVRRNTHYQAGGNHPEFGSFWTYEKLTSKEKE